MPDPAAAYVLDRPKLAKGVASNDDKEGGTPIEVKLLGAMGGRASVVEGETGVPIPPPPMEETGAELKNESSDVNITE